MRRPVDERRASRITIALGALVATLSCASLGADAGSDLSAEDEAAIMAVLDRYMDALNDLDVEGHVATYHFPHYRHASGKIIVWDTPAEAMPLLGVNATDRRAALRKVLEPDWDRSEWTRRDVVQVGRGKVHVVTRFDRLRADGSVIKSFDSLYVMTLEEDAAGAARWGIRGRSSFAP